MIVVDRAQLEPTAVGASEVGALLGCDPWTTPLQLYRRKLGLEPAKPDNVAMALGRALEGPVVDLARERIPLLIRRNRRTFAASRDAALFATPDAFVGRDRLLEVKVVGLRSGDAFDDELPCRTKLQVQAQLAVTGREAGWVAQLVGTELRLTLVEGDTDVQATIVSAAHAFRELHLEPAIPPDPLTWDERWADLLLRMADVPDVDVLAGGAIQEAGDRILVVRELQAQLEDEVRLLREELLGALADGHGSRLVGTGWKAALQVNAGRVDWKAVALEVAAAAALEDLEPVVARFRGPANLSFVVRSSTRDS